ncbi:Endonuclease/exonuclease/phosphatase [Rhizoctonia solani]|nr:Endonuclease/exonuclease/phosphatase [Rhizoctonia solani]
MFASPLNVARSNSRVQALLNTLSNFDICVLQEPWWGRIGSERSVSDVAPPIFGIVANPAWELFVPSALDPGITGLSACLRPDIISSPDILAVSIDFIGTSILILNVYNAGSGDFNLHHPAWALSSSSLRPSSSSSESLLEWIVSNDFTVANDLSIATRRGQSNQSDSIIDLTLFDHDAVCDDIFRSWECSEHLSFGSDHNAISWLIHPREDDAASFVPAVISPSYCIDAGFQDEWLEAFLQFILAHSLPSAYLASEDIDKGANIILDAMQAATSRTMPKRSLRPPSCSFWWNKACDLAVRDLKRASASHDPIAQERVRHHMRSTFRLAKWEFCGNEEVPHSSYLFV